MVIKQKSFNLKLRKVFLSLSLILLSNSFSSYAYQKESPFEISLVPSVSPFGFSFYVFDEGSYFQEPKYTKRLMGSTGFYWGLGLQFYLWNEWTATFNLSQADFGGGFKSELMHDNGHIYAKFYLTTSMTLNQFSLNLEKELGQLKLKTISNYSSRISSKVLFGLKINKVGNYFLSDSRNYYDHRGLEFNRYSEVINLNSGAIDIGWTNQIYINNRQSLKLGIIYSYGFRPIEKENYKVDYFYHGVKDEFTVLTGKHSLLLYAAYPIVLYRNKAQRDFVGKKRRSERR